VLQCAAVCCSVLQCVAVRCSLLQCVAVFHLREDRAPDRADDGHSDDADAGGSADMSDDEGSADRSAESGPGEVRVRWRTERRPLAAESSPTCRGGGAMRLRPNPSPASAAAAAVTATVRGDRPVTAELPPPALLLPPRVERGVGAPFPPWVERGVALVRAGLCIRNDDGLMPGTDLVERGLRPRVDKGSSPKNPPTISSSAPKVGVCNIGELAENIDGVRPIGPNSRYNDAPTAELGTYPEFGTRLDPPARLRAEDAPVPRALSGCALAERLDW